VPNHVVEIHRYPVKSMGGESLEQVEVDQRGLVGDRWFAVTDDEGHLASGKRTRRFRRHDEVFGFQAATVDGGVEVCGGDRRWLVGDPELDTALSSAMGRRMAVAAEGEVPHQDAGAVSLIGTATLSWCAQELSVDADPRRLRVNLVVETTEPFVEETWLGEGVEVGTAALRLVAMTQRCRMIDLAQQGREPIGRWLKPLAQRRGMNLGVYASVVTPGLIGVGSDLDASRVPNPAGTPRGW
jgi:hypothetical protein